MILATSNLVPGIDADCGGNARATCHVNIAEPWQSKALTRQRYRRVNAGFEPDRKNFTLGLLIPLTDDLSGIVVNLPEFQY